MEEVERLYSAKCLIWVRQQQVAVVVGFYLLAGLAQRGYNRVNSRTFQAGLAVSHARRTRSYTMAVHWRAPGWMDPAQVLYCDEPLRVSVYLQSYYGRPHAGPFSGGGRVVSFRCA